MSIKSKMVKALSALTAMSIVACASITGFAATYTTTTQYNLGGNTVQATTVVTEVGDTEQVTYLVHNDQDGTIADGDIVYINQTAADDNGTATFNYQTTTTKINNLSTKVLVGAQTTPISAPADSKDATIDPYAVDLNVTLPEGGLVGINDGAVIGKGETIDFDIIPNSGFLIESVTIGGAPQDTTGTAYSITGGDNNAIDIVFAAQGGESGISDGVVPEKNINETDSTQNYLTTFGAVSVAEEDQAKTIEFGILFAVGSKIADDMEYGDADVIAFKAFGQGTDGKFAVKLLDGGSDLIADGQTYTTRTYLMIDGVVVDYGAINVQ